MNIGVTGASGFVGKNLIPYLNNTAHNIKILKIRNTEGFDFRGLQVVVHLAGKAHDLKKTSRPHEYYEVNFELTKQLYDVFINSHVTKFIFISSVKAAVDSVETLLNEEDSPNPQTYYGKSKLMAEEYIQSQKLPAGKSYFILRPCMIHGPGNKGNLNLLHRFVSKGLPYPLAAFDNKRSFLSIENLCFVLKEILERDDISSGIYNVADDDALSTNDVVELLAEAQGKPARLWPLSKNLIFLLAKVGDKLKLPLNSERLQKLTESYVVSNEKIKGVLGKELPVSAREGILRTAKSFKKDF